MQNVSSTLRTCNISEVYAPAIKITPSQQLLTVLTGFLTAKKLRWSHNDHQYLDVMTTFTNFNSFTTFS